MSEKLYVVDGGIGSGRYYLQLEFFLENFIDTLVLEFVNALICFKFLKNCIICMLFHLIFTYRGWEILNRSAPSEHELTAIFSKVKLVNNLMFGIHLATAAEAMALGARAGLNVRNLFNIISTAAGSSWYHHRTHVYSYQSSVSFGSELEHRHFYNIALDK